MPSSRLSTSKDPTGAPTPVRIRVLSEEPTPWRFSPVGLAVRLFLTVWMVYAVHFATNIVREIYPAVALGDHFSFRVDEYGGLHPDLFEKKGYGWHIGNNPGASMLAAVPYALARPIIDPIVERVNAGRRESAGPPAYNTPWPNSKAFFEEAWRRGLDIKLGLAALVMQVLCMAPVSALGVVAMFYLLRHLFRSDRAAVWLSLLYAFGTPVFYRAGFLNHNMMLGHFAFIGFLAIWNPGGLSRPSERMRYVLAGVTAGNAVLYDYSGVVLLGALFVYAVAKGYGQRSRKQSARLAAWFTVGSLPPIFLLWFYQWRSFGHPFYPGQQWMPPVEWIDIGYQGYGYPVPELLVSLLVDHRYGLFVTAPILLLALAAPFVNRGAPRRLPQLEFWFSLLVFVAMWIFFSGNNYTRLQFNTGLRYMAPIIPFLFVPTAMVLVRMRPLAAYLIAVLSVMIAWPMAMYRYVQYPLGVFDPVVRTFTHGLALPVLSALSQTTGQYGDYFTEGVSPLPLFLLVGALLYPIWSQRFTRHRGRSSGNGAQRPAPSRAAR